MAAIIITNAVHAKLDALVDTMHDSKYYGNRAAAKKYVDAIYDFVYTIPNRQHYPTQNKRLGAWYCAYLPNKRTTWYVIFDKQDYRYLIRNIINNHGPDYPAFIKAIK